MLQTLFEELVAADRWFGHCVRIKQLSVSAAGMRGRQQYVFSVAQIGNLIGNRQSVREFEHTGTCRGAAECHSAIQQITNLRYETVLCANTYRQRLAVNA